MGTFTGVGPTASNLTAHGFRTQVVFNEVGGNDNVHFLDTPGQDLFYSYADFSLLLAGNSYLRSDTFANINAYSSQGSDQARLFGTAGNETLLYTADNAALTRADGSLVQAWDFGHSFANLQSGGSDWVQFQGSVGDDLLTGDFAALTLSGQGYAHQVSGFTAVGLFGRCGKRRSLSLGLGRE